MKTRHFAISQQGDSHVKSGKNCQDCGGTIGVLNERLKLEMSVAAIADGVGSCDYSEFGSKIAVKTVLDMLGQELASLQELSDKTVPELIKKAFQQAYDNIEAEATEKEIPFLLFDTTLTVAVLVENGNCYVGHIGDDGIVALFDDGSYSMITTRIEGEEANSVVPLSSGAETWQFSVAKQPVAALALMTDGLLDKAVGSVRMKNRVYYPFFKPMFESIMENDQDENELRSYWNEYLSNEETRSGYGITDDITLVVVQVPELLKRVHPAPFDEQKWKEDSEAMRRKNEEALCVSPLGRLPKTAQAPQPTAPADSSIDHLPPSDSTEEVNTSSSSGEKALTSGEDIHNGHDASDTVQHTLSESEAKTDKTASDLGLGTVSSVEKDEHAPLFSDLGDGTPETSGKFRSIVSPFLGLFRKKKNSPDNITQEQVEVEEKKTSIRASDDSEQQLNQE